MQCTERPRILASRPASIMQPTGPYQNQPFDSREKPTLSYLEKPSACWHRRPGPRAPRHQRALGCSPCTSTRSQPAAGMLAKQKGKTKVVPKAKPVSPKASDSDEGDDWTWNGNSAEAHRTAMGEFTLANAGEYIDTLPAAYVNEVAQRLSLAGVWTQQTDHLAHTQLADALDKIASHASLDDMLLILAKYAPLPSACPALSLPFLPSACPCLPSACPACPHDLDQPALPASACPACPQPQSRQQAARLRMRAFGCAKLAAAGRQQAGAYR